MGVQEPVHRPPLNNEDVSQIQSLHLFLFLFPFPPSPSPSFSSFSVNLMLIGVCFCFCFVFVFLPCLDSIFVFGAPKKRKSKSIFPPSFSQKPRPLLPLFPKDGVESFDEKPVCTGGSSGDQPVPVPAGAQEDPPYPQRHQEGLHRTPPPAPLTMELLLSLHYFNWIGYGGSSVLQAN